MDRALTLVAATVCMSLGISSSVGTRTVLEGTWQGSYTCGERPRSVKIMMETFRDHHTGVFIFRDDQGVEGRFNFTAYLPGRNVFKTRPGRWIVNPGGWSTVALSGEISPDEKTIGGTVAGSGCSRFEIRKIH
jgi:hypothetical protein